VLLIVIAFFWRAGPLRRQLRASIADQLARQTNRNVSVGDVSLSPTGQVIVRQLAIRNKDGSALLIAPEAAVRVGRPFSLFSASTAVQALQGITLSRPEITLVRDVSRRWNVEDLLKVKPRGPARFTGDVSVEKGRLTIIDQSRGATTTIEDLDFNLQQPGPGQISFSVRARGADKSFDLLEASGVANSEARTADISGKVSNLDIGYVSARFPEIAFMKIAAGRADISGKYQLSPQTPDRFGAGVSSEAEIRDAEVAFPWLKKPVKEIKGKVRFEDGDIHLDGITGNLVGAPVEAGGTISNVAAPQLDIKYRTWGLRFEQLKSLMPKVLAPLTLVLPSPLTIEAQVKGPAMDPVVEGTAQVKVVKFHLVPWHDAVADFTYTKGKLRIQNLHAHGSPRQLEANIKIEWGKALKTLTTANFSLVNVPVRDFAQMIGVQEVALEGMASFTGSASLDEGRLVRGKFVIRDAVARGVRLGEVRGEVEYSGQTVVIKHGHVQGPLGEADFSARVSLPDRYTLQADFSRIDLSAIGGQVGKPRWKGKLPATVRAAGALRGMRTGGSFRTGPGQFQGRALEFLQGDFALSPDRARFSNVHIALRRGTAEGEMIINDWQRMKEHAPLAGRFSFQNIAPGDWLPMQYGMFVTGALNGALEISGSMDDPTVLVDVQSISVTSPGPIVPAGSARLRYHAQAFTIESLNLEEGRTHLKIASETTPTGLQYTVSGDEVDLGYLTASLRKRYGLAIDEKARWKVRATVRDPLTTPKADFTIYADSVIVNGLPFTDISLSGYYGDGILTIRPPPQAGATLKQAGSSFTVYGTLGLPPAGKVDLTMDLSNVDVLTVQSMIDRAYLQLDSQGVKMPSRSPYFALARPFSGKLDSRIQITGLASQPEVVAPLKVTELQFGGTEIEKKIKIEGEVRARLFVQDHRAAGLQRLDMDLRATQATAIASVSGHVSPGAEMQVKIDVTNLDLTLLRPWLQYTADLNGFKLEGTAMINFNVAGTTGDPTLDGDISIDSLALGPLLFENARAFPIRLRERVISIDELTFSDFPMQAIGTASIPLDSGLGPPSAHLEIKQGRFGPLADMPPILFNANLHLKGNTVYLSRELPEPGKPALDGLRDAAETGKLRAHGTAEFTRFSAAKLGENRFDITAELSDFDLNIPGMIKGKLDGKLKLVNAPLSDHLILATPGLATLPAVAAEAVAPDGLSVFSIRERDVSLADAVAKIEAKTGAKIALQGEVAGTVSLSRDDATVVSALEDIHDQTGVFWWRAEDGTFHVSASPPPWVSVHLRDVSISDAVAEIKDKTGASIALHGQVTGTVTLSRDDATVGRLLEDIYDETGVFWWCTEDGTFHLSASPPPEANPIVLSHATLQVPRGLPPAQGGLLFAPDLRMRVQVGDGVEFRYGSGSRPTQVQVDPGGYLYLGGQPSADKVVVEGEAESHKGVLSFPNGTLTLRRGLARLTLTPGTKGTGVARLAAARPSTWPYLAVTRPAEGWGEAGTTPSPARPPRIWVSAEADGHIGGYYVSLNPIGQIYPPPTEAQAEVRELGYALNAVSIPALDEVYVMALLAGPVISPAIGPESRDIARLLSYSGTPGVPVGEVTGVTLPTLGSLSPASPQISFAVPFQGPVQLRVGERVFSRVLVSYLSPLSGPIDSRALTITYEVTPRWSFGWTFSPIDRLRWEAQALFPF
jgi:hypothetical protein